MSLIKIRGKKSFDIACDVVRVHHQNLGVIRCPRNKTNRQLVLSESPSLSPTVNLLAALKTHWISPLILRISDKIDRESPVTYWPQWRLTEPLRERTITEFVVPAVSLSVTEIAITIGLPPSLPHPLRIQLFFALQRTVRKHMCVCVCVNGASHRQRNKGIEELPPFFQWSPREHCSSRWICWVMRRSLFITFPPTGIAFWPWMQRHCFTANQSNHSPFPSNSQFYTRASHLLESGKSIHRKERSDNSGKWGQLLSFFIL